MAFALKTIGSITLFFVSRCGYPYPTSNACSGLLNASTRCPIINSQDEESTVLDQQNTTISILCVINKFSCSWKTANVKCWDT